MKLTREEVAEIEKMLEDAISGYRDHLHPDAIAHVQADFSQLLVEWAASGLGPCSTCGTLYEECPISEDGTEWTTDANGNHNGLCCEDCWHSSQYGREFLMESMPARHECGRIPEGGITIAMSAAMEKP